MENRVVEINNLITRIAMSNKDISSSQIARARAIYQNDPRPIEEIEKELLEYSAQISSHSKITEAEFVAPTIDNSELNLQKNIEIEDKKIENISAEYAVGTKEITKEEPTSSIPLESPIEAEQSASDNIMVDYTGDVGITPIGEHGFVPPSYIPDATFPRKSSSSSDLNMMFDQPMSPIKQEKAKQFVKTTQSKEAGFSSSIAILATAGMLSIITIALAIAILIF